MYKQRGLGPQQDLDFDCKTLLYFSSCKTCDSSFDVICCSGNKNEFRFESTLSQLRGMNILGQGPTLAAKAPIYCTCMLSVDSQLSCQFAYQMHSHYKQCRSDWLCDSFLPFVSSFKQQVSKEKKDHHKVVRRSLGLTSSLSDHDLRKGPFSSPRNTNFQFFYEPWSLLPSIQQLVNVARQILLSYFSIFISTIRSHSCFHSLQQLSSCIIQAVDSCFFSL